MESERNLRSLFRLPSSFSKKLNGSDAAVVYEYGMMMAVVMVLLMVKVVVTMMVVIMALVITEIM